MGKKFIRQKEEKVKKAIAKILRYEIQDRRLKSITITGVDMASDLKSAKVFYAPIGKLAENLDLEVLEEIISNATGFIQLKLSDYVKLRYTPQLSFHYDDVLARGLKIEEIIRDLDEKDSKEDSENN